MSSAVRCSSRSSRSFIVHNLLVLTLPRNCLFADDACRDCQQDVKNQPQNRADGTFVEKFVQELEGTEKIPRSRDFLPQLAVSIRFCGSLVYVQTGRRGARRLFLVLILC